MISGASGFYNAPILKFITFSTGVTTLLPYASLKRFLELHSLESLTQHFEIWRLVTCNFFFSSALEAMLGIFLLYHFRMFERQMGSAKFAAYTTITWGVSTIFTIACTVLFNPKGYTAAGPYSLIFSLLVQYYFEVPATYRFRFLGLDGSNKIVLYIVGLQLLGSRLGINPLSLILASSGIIAGLIYRSDSLTIKRWTIPKFLAQFASKYILPMLQQPQRSQPVNRTVNINAPRAPPPPQAVPPPAETDIAALMDLGFSREAALGALRNAHNDTQLAAALLLDPS